MLLLGAAAPAFAQSTGSQPNLQAVPQGSPIPRVLPPAPPATTPRAEPPALPPAGAEMPDRTVQVTDVLVEGVTAFPLPQIVGYTRDLTGTAVPLQKIDAARQQILQEYRSAGYVLSTVSASLDASGRLRFIVTEGHIASVKLDGDIGPAGVQVLRFLRRLTEAKPIDSRTLERYLLLAQDVPGVSLRAVLQPSADEPGALNLVAQISRQPVSGLMTVDNRAFNQTGPIEALAVLDMNSFSELGEKSELTFFHTFPDSQNFYQFAEEMFLGGSGLKLRLYAGNGEAIPSGGGAAALSAEGYHGTTTVLGGTLTYPVIRSRQQTLNVYATLDALESQVWTNTGTFGARARQSFDSLRVARFGSDYAMSDLWFGAERSAVNAVSVRLSHGLRALGAETNGTADDAARQNERSGFLKLNFELSRTQTLFAPWDGASVAVMGLAAGQWSNDILPPAEQFYLGGSRFTRGYYAGQVPGDKALAATVELQLNTNTDFALWGWSADVSSQFYLFYDWGETWQNQKTDFATILRSAGGGIRLQLTRFTELDFEALARFNRFPTGASNTNATALNDVGLFWRLLGRF